jgi:hypothetical protein
VNEELYGPKKLAAALDIDQRTAKAILSVIADVEVAPGIRRLSQEGYRAYLKKCKTNGNVPRKERAVGGKTTAPQWHPA